MRFLLVSMLAFFPLFINAQTQMLDSAYHPSIEFDSRLLVSEASGQGKTDAEENHNRFPQTGQIEFSSACSKLVSGKWLHFTSNILGYSAPLLGLRNQTSGDEQKDSEVLKLNTIGKLLGIGSTISSLSSTFVIGQAGGKFKMLERESRTETHIYLNAAGKNLEKFRKLTFISVGLDFFANFMLVRSISEFEENNNDDAVSKLAIAGSALMFGFFTSIVAVDKIGEAGKNLELAGNSQIPGNRYKAINEAATALKGYNNKWDKGLRFTIFGSLLAGAGGGLYRIDANSKFGSTKGVGLGLMCFGGLSILVGHIYMQWVSPAELGKAGAKLNNI